MKTYRVKSEEQAKGLAEDVLRFPLPFTATIAKGTIKRTTEQNALLHKWFGQIAQHLGDCTMLDVKGECHHRWGLPIKIRNPQWAWVWKHSSKALTYEQQCGFLASDVLNVSSSMSVAELSEYMDAMQAHFLAKGVPLVNPEDRRAEQWA